MTNNNRIRERFRLRTSFIYYRPSAIDVAERRWVNDIEIISPEEYIYSTVLLIGKRARLRRDYRFITYDSTTSLLSRGRAKLMYPELMLITAFFRRWMSSY